MTNKKTGSGCLWKSNPGKCTSCTSGCVGCLSTTDCRNAGTECKDESTGIFNCYNSTTECGSTCGSCLNQQTCSAKSGCAWITTLTPAACVLRECTFDNCQPYNGCVQEYTNSVYSGCHSTSCTSGCTGCSSTTDCRNAATECKDESTGIFNCYNSTTECGSTCASCLNQETCLEKSDCEWNTFVTPAVCVENECSFSDCQPSKGCIPEYTNLVYSGCHNYYCRSECSSCPVQLSCEHKEGCYAEKDPNSVFKKCCNLQTECSCESLLNEAACAAAGGRCGIELNGTAFVSCYDMNFNYTCEYEYQDCDYDNDDHYRCNTDHDIACYNSKCKNDCSNCPRGCNACRNLISCNAHGNNCDWDDDSKTCGYHTSIYNYTGNGTSNGTMDGKAKVFKKRKKDKKKKKKRLFLKK